MSAGWENGVMQPQVKGCGQPPDAERQEEILLEVPGGVRPERHGLGPAREISDFGRPELHFCGIGYQVHIYSSR